MKIIKRVLISIMVVSAFLYAYYQFWFLRQPARNIPNNNTLFVAPANGKVVSVKKWSAENLMVKKGMMGVINVWTKDVDTAGTIISIQMDVTNVHYQRAPTGGRVVSKHYQKGNFNNAVVMSNEYGLRFENEHNEFLLETTTGKKYKVVQIAGFVARRIVDFTTDNQPVKQGDVIGLIKLGSQVSVLLPHGVDVDVKVGDVTTDGETILGHEQ
ncbi:MAG TPA: phosphatidylserine decarboxylase [Chitinophagales bacterium]|nr:phosphatidylserine decarboxylase [Chitinophagales bacterium]